VTIFQGNRELLLAFRAGDREALASVYWHYLPWVERLLRRGFGSGDVRVPGLADPDVSDVLQDTFARAFSAPGRNGYDGLRPYRNYLLRIARNIMIDRARIAGRVELDADIGEEADDDDESAEEIVEHSRLQQATQVFVRGLDPESRELVRLRFEDERSQEAVAAAMGVSRRRIRTLEKRVREGLERHLAAAGLGEELTHGTPAAERRPPSVGGSA
jgi:RNA polymerase sigma factor (sigma-70 family)